MPDPLAAVAGWPAVAAVAVVTPAGTAAITGGAERVRPWASVSKLLTALGVLVAVEEGTLGLDEPLGPPGSTVAHLLAHASGLAPDTPEPIASPGSRRIYSNAGFELLGRALAEASGMPFVDYLREAVLDPLGMTATAFAGSPASGAEGPLDDLARLGAELLAPRLLSSATVARATSVAFPHLDGVLPGYGLQSPNDWGLGFEIRSGKDPHWTGRACSPETFGHFGRSGSFLWVDPLAGVACAELADRAWGPWAKRAWPPLSDQVIASFGSGGSRPAPAG